MKKCPFCAEEVQDEAIKCRYCGEQIDLPPPTVDEDSKSPWYYKGYSIILGFMCIGPFILPLVWMNPHYSVKKRIIITIVISCLTGLLVLVAWWSISMIIKAYNII